MSDRRPGKRFQNSQINEIYRLALGDPDSAADLIGVLGSFAGNDLYRGEASGAVDGILDHYSGTGSLSSEIAFGIRTSAGEFYARIGRDDRPHNHLAQPYPPPERPSQLNPELVARGANAPADHGTAPSAAPSGAYNPDPRTYNPHEDIARNSNSPLVRQRFGHLLDELDEMREIDRDFRDGRHEYRLARQELAKAESSAGRKQINAAREELERTAAQTEKPAADFRERTHSVLDRLEQAINNPGAQQVDVMFAKAVIEQMYNHRLLKGSLTAEDPQLERVYGEMDQRAQDLIKQADSRLDSWSAQPVAETAGPDVRPPVSSPAPGPG